MKDRVVRGSRGVTLWTTFCQNGLTAVVLLGRITVYCLCKVNKKVNANKARTNISEYNAGSEE